jgi:hypothetical protein
MNQRPRWTHSSVLRLLHRRTFLLVFSSRLAGLVGAGACVCQARAQPGGMGEPSRRELNTTALIAVFKGLPVDVSPGVAFALGTL